MLRITEQRAGERLVLKLEGRISGDWVTEVDTSWRSAVASGERSICVDLSDVSRVDSAGQALLARMYRAGVRFMTRGCVLRELVREIREMVES
jgi:ABC-type transporter Mla MlaB component